MGQGLNRAETDFQQRCIVVLGMHRSGTSAVTRVVNLLGVDIGERFLPPAPDNPKGFWEHREIHDIHEKLLEEIGSAWDDVTTLPDNWWSGNSAMRVRSELIESCRRDFKDAELWGLKEPRTCRLVKLWLPIFAELKCQPFFIIVFRDPREVASSLKQRNNFQFSKSLLLWLEHVLASERETRDYPRVFISFEKLLADWQATMEFTS
jgi:hypothetical protein